MDKSPNWDNWATESFPSQREKRNSSLVTASNSTDFRLITCIKIVFCNFHNFSGGWKAGSSLLLVYRCQSLNEVKHNSVFWSFLMYNLIRISAFLLVGLVLTQGLELEAKDPRSF